MITIKNLSSKKTDKKYIFSDLNLSLEEQKTSTNLRNSNIVSKNDLVIDTDLNAIKNSIKNILTQKRHLSPEKNIFLQKYLGTVVSETHANAIGEEIERVIYLYEPRVKIDKIQVYYNVDQMYYNIVLHLSLLNFDENIQIVQAFLDVNGNFDFINR